MAILPNFDDGQNEQNKNIRKRQKRNVKVFIIRITPKAFQLTARVRSSL